ncbi:synaptotagmin-14 [Lingula anatina]|uniref:Synaptotagmin-14 n=1 Tax=Lingula anatina TaxID=7574 RepID=A0A1S3HK62_LINAN|nr:synaptotagmin-14 [Lingula anatina]|eukprot:XP_013386505.1 synaptotagmin-14 [Lingula anatina]
MNWTHELFSNLSLRSENDTEVMADDILMETSLPTQTEETFVKYSFQVPIEAYAFLGAVVCFMLLLLVFFLYLNKQLCFKDCGGFPCIDRPKDKKDKVKELGTAYAYENDTSSDSDDEVLRRYQMGLQRSSSVHSKVGKSKDNGHRSEEEKKVVEKDLISLNDQGDGHNPSHKSESDLSSTAASPHHEDRGDMPGYDNAGFEGSPTKGAQSDTRPPGAASDENLFDVSDILQPEPPLISKCGSIEVSFSYDAAKQRMNVGIIQAKDIPTRERGGANHTQVRLLLLPSKKQRHKTRVKTGEDPIFQEEFLFTKIAPEEVNDMGVRIRLYGTERMRRERMIGECIIGFASLSLEGENTHWVNLEPRSNLSHGESGFDMSSLSRSDSASSTQSMQHGGMPELLLGLAYNGTTGRLSVEVIKGSNFRNMAMNRAPDTYVKLTLMSPNGQEITRAKTSIRRGQPNPLFKETFMFQVALFQLPDVTLMVSVYNKRSMKRKEMIGWFSLGMNSSGEEEISHWNDMRESRGETVCRWHVLLEP